jgi:hypothetical protein
MSKCAWYDLPCQGRNVAEAAANTAAAARQAAIDTARRVAETALNTGLQAAGVSPKEFWGNINELGGNLSVFIDRGAEVAGGFLAGAKLGVQGFVDHLPEHFKKGLKDWLKLPIDIFDLVANFDLKKVPDLLLQLVGYSWDDLLGLVQEVVGPSNFALLLRIYEVIGGALDKGVVNFIGEEVSNLEQKRCQEPLLRMVFQ